ncbi:DUF4331 domain-containing protein [Polyangium fumosum]|uniref:DUF4331 domain-containing protein n=1 Tax=Polyangium fumosum TaxID=889272 RepID=A0A4U1JBK5_9BACT|nr:DUF4331 domain-containing protein [Polyangium fumosum]TKD07417.1 DUF4331 domain-containing protein [Polyangium fumosum]
MMKRMTWTSAALAALTILGTAGTAMASSHAEAPGIGEDPRADNTDLYAWVEGGNLVILANYIPLEEPAAGPNFHKFSDDVLYEIHIARGPSSLNDALTYQIRFKSTAYPSVDPADLAAPVGGGKEFFSQLSGATQTYSVTKLVNGANPTVVVNDAPVAPPNVGPRTNALAYQIPPGKTYEQYFVDESATSVVRNLNGGEGRVFAGPRDDGFGVDLGAIFDLAGLETVLGGTPYDNVSGYNVHTIALEIPLAVANGGAAVVPGTANDNQTIGVWASASRRKTRILRKKESADGFGPWVPVSRLGLPLINEAVIGIQDKDKYNRTHPKDDVANFGAYILNPVIVRDAEFAGFYMAGGPLAACPGGPAGLKSNRTDIIDTISLNGMFGHNITAIGDVLRVDLGIPSQFPNGRKVNKGTNKEEDVTDIELSLLLCKLAANVPDGVDTNDATFKNGFPYLAPPWEGSTRGKGE